MISKGRTNLEAKIDFVYETFKVLIHRIEQSYENDLQDIHNVEVGIYEDSTLDQYAKHSILKQYFDERCSLSNQEKNAMEVIFCSIFSFWEKSLSEYYKMVIQKTNGKAKTYPKIKDYLEIILVERIDICPCVLREKLDELRNYFIHGTLTEEREKIIQNLSVDNIRVKHFEDKYFFESFETIYQILEIVYDTLKKIASYVEQRDFSSHT